ncbi:MAG: hypothetical protein L3K26_17735, partial [Candidatus Hydrogenedentes bacterium]|nr:hypothetical protein [Candidatus Hydrogenedentota bacterium]
SAFTALKAIYDESETAQKAQISTAYLSAWQQVTEGIARDIEGSTASNDRSSFWFYARDAGHFIRTEEELVPVLKEKCLDSGIARGQYEFLNALSFAPIPLGQLAATEAEQLYCDMLAEQSGGFARCGDGTTTRQIHRILGRSGRPGLEAMLRIGTESREEGIYALGINDTPEAEAILWNMYENCPENHARSRIQILRALSGRRGETQVQEARRARIRAALSPYLQLPAGEVNLWNMEHAVALAKDTRDPYYFPHVTELEAALRQLSDDQFDPEGSNLSVAERRAALYTHLDEATAKLRDAKPLD